jgi:hypothetical protein
MINKEVLECAKKQIRFIAAENNFTLIEGLEMEIRIEFPSGKSLKLADSEIEYQAKAYLQDLIEQIENNY